jgi:hypothetical protein
MDFRAQVSSHQFLNLPTLAFTIYFRTEISNILPSADQRQAVTPHFMKSSLH